MRCPTLLALLTGVILYLVMGALVFSALESPNENKAYEKLLDVKHTFLGNETCVTELDFLKLVKVSDTTNILPLNSQFMFLSPPPRYGLDSLFFLVDVYAQYVGIFVWKPKQRKTIIKHKIDL